MKTIYECSQSKSVKWFTAIFLLFVVVAVLLELYAVSRGADVTEAIIVTALLLLVVSCSCFALVPLYIIADDEGIGVRTSLRTIRIPYSHIDHIERMDGQKRLFGATKTIRLFGVGGVFGYIGWFRTKDIGIYHSYATDPKKVFLIYRTKGMPIAISVSDPDEFMPYYLKGGTR